MTETVLYEVLHCLVAACLAVWLLCRVIHTQGPLMLYALAAAAACLFLGDAYWLAHLIIRGAPPAIFSACDVAYIGFLLMFSTALPNVEPRRLGEYPFAVWMAVFALLNVVAWMVWTGEWFNNLLWGVPMMVLVMHSAMLVGKDLSRARRNVLGALLALVSICEAAALAGFAHPALDLLCCVLWALSFLQLVNALKGTGRLARLTVPAWALLTAFCECASFLAQDAVYYGFQVLTMACLVCAAWSAAREGEARHAV